MATVTWTNLHSQLQKILSKAIKKGGSSIRDFKDTLGSSGNYQKEFKVYQQEGLKCKTKKRVIFIVLLQVQCLVATQRVFRQFLISKFLLI